MKQPEQANLRQAFEVIPLPDYAAPERRPVMGRYNDRMYEMQQAILQEELDDLAAREGLAAALRALYAQQTDIGFIQDDFSQVSYFRYRAAGNGEDQFFIVQFNPRRAERFKGAGRKVAPPGAVTVSTSDPSCFLCVDNIRWQHRGVQGYYSFQVNDRGYNALCNPFPFMKAHLTMAAGEHISQAFHVQGDEDATRERIRRIVEDLYGIAAQLPTFVGFYNGVGAGASIEKHLHYHFFEIPDGHGRFPLQAVAQRTERRSPARRPRSGGALRLQVEGYPMIAFRISGERAAVIDEVVALTLEWDLQLGEAASGNISAIWEDGAVALYFIPRNKFYTRSPGLAGMVAGLETLGEFILCTDEEYRAINEQRVDYDYLWRILEAVSPHEAPAPG